MSRPQENREIDVTRARPKKGAARAVQSAPAPSAPAAQAGRPDAPHAEPQSIARRAAPAPQGKAKTAPASPNAGDGVKAATGKSGKAAPGRRKKRTGRQKTGIAALCVLLALAVLAGGAYLYVDSLISRSDLGSFDNAKPPESTSENPSIVPPDFAGVRNLLVLGLDYDNEGKIVRDKKHPNTDMILYVRLDGNAHTMTMLQIPRDTFVGEAGGGAGKINGILAKNVDIGDGNGLGALKTYIETNFGLPIDEYVTIDIEALRDMVDAFDGVKVYVPRDMRYYDEKTGELTGELLQGWRWLKGAECEYFLRYRQGLARADLDRLVMQRQFYAALFRRLKTASVGDIVKLLPVAQKYIKTDISTLDLMSIAIEVSGMDSANISMGRLPVYGSDQLYAGEYSVVVTAKEETAALLNEYFRPADDPITASDIGTAEWPTTGGAAGAEMSTMSDVDAVGANEPEA